MGQRDHTGAAAARPRITHVVFILPKSSILKLQRREMRCRIARLGEDHERHYIENPALSSVGNLIMEVIATTTRRRILT
jgi:hypothetical protein